MWQAMLMSAGLPCSKQILIHGFMTNEGRKMSKSLGNVVDPLKLVRDFGTDAVRYYLLKYVHPFEDSDFSLESFRETYNADLANGLGNLVSRTANMIEKDGLEIEVKKAKGNKRAEKLIEEYQFNEALKEITGRITEADQLIDRTKPWQLAKASKEKAVKVLTEAVEAILSVSLQLKPLLPETAGKIEKIFTAKKIAKPKEPLFPRINY